MHIHRLRSRLAVRAAAAVLLAACAGACSPRSTIPLPTRASAHVERLAGVIGSRPGGTAPNQRAREYVVEQLRASGFEVHVQEANAERPGLGLTARVANVIAVRPGTRRDAVALMAHYDSVPDGPGAADDAFGTAVCLEAGRLLAARPSPARTLVVILTDGEEFSLMGASAVLKDPIRNRIRAVLNFEAIGSGSPVMLFETGDGSGALIRAWARHAPFPAGASFMPEIYKAISLGGDRTDLGLFRRAGFPGLDFAIVGDGYTYHTRLDTPGRLDPRAIDRAVADAVATVDALDGVDLPGAADAGSTFFDVLGLRAVSYGHLGELAVFGLAMLAALVAWFHVAGVARRDVRTSAVLLTVPWLALGLACVALGMTAAAWLSRATSESLHPWYAHPDRFVAWLVLVGLVSGRLVMRASRWLPPRARGAAHPAVVWLMALPVWMLLLVMAGLNASASSFLIAWPLLAAGVCLLAFPVDRPGGMRGASAVVLVVVGVLWVPDVILLLHFTVSELGRDPLVTPLAAYPALLLAGGVAVLPPALALAATWAGRSGSRASWAADALLGVAAVVAFGVSWLAPAYTSERPLRHAIRYVADMTTGESVWESSANEPRPPAASWQRGPSLPAAAEPIGALAGPFVYHAAAPGPVRPPFTVTASLAVGAEATLEIDAVPEEPAWTIAVALPPDVIPLETNTAISRRGSRQVAIFRAVPADGLRFRGRFEAGDAAHLRATTVLAMGYGLHGTAWPHLPAWLPQQADVWEARRYYVLPIRWTTGAEAER